MRRTLMHRNQALLDFEVDVAEDDVRILDAPDADAAADTPLAAMGLAGPDGAEFARQIIRERTLSPNREDLDPILDALGARSPLELALMGHGLSLMDDLWYRAPGSTERWEDVNFFDNGWDAGFGTAVLAADYEGLASCSPDTPDVTTRGSQVKAWERNEDGIRLIKHSLSESQVDFQGALLAAELCRRLFGEDAYQPLEIVERQGARFSATPLMISRDEELVQGFRLFAMGGYSLAEARDLCGPALPDTYADILTRSDVENVSACVAQAYAFKALSLLSDMHAGNFGIIRNVETGARRAALPFDYDHAFGFPFDDFPVDAVCANPALAALLCAKNFSDLDPAWDWGWYDPQALDGFEGLIVEAYEGDGSLPPDFAKLVARLFVIQRSYVNELSSTGEGTHGDTGLSAQGR